MENAQITDKEMEIIRHTKSNKYRELFIAFLAGKYGFDQPTNILVRDDKEMIKISPHESMQIASWFGFD